MIMDGATIHKRIKLMSHSGMKANAEKEQQKREQEREKGSASNVNAYLVFVYGNKLPIICACLC